MNPLTRWLTLIALFCVAWGVAPGVRAATDPANPGPYPIATEDYNYGLGAYTPPDLKSKTTGLPLGPNELDGRVYYPKGVDDGKSALPGGPMPLIVLVHGRHGTTYNPATNKTGTGWPPVAPLVQIPSYAGYDYLGNLLASWGYVVVSIGVNGINFFDNSSPDDGMLARAETIQKSLDIWKTISTMGGASVATTYGVADPFGTKFVGKIDMSVIGTMGHSRGGEGVMAHYVYNADTVNNPEAAAAGGPAYPIKAVFAIAPVDFERYNATGVPIAVILPYCDGDVSDNQGIHFFDDARYAVPGDPTPKYYWTVMGADHDLYNTVWDPALFPAGAADDWAGTPGGAIDPFAGPTVPGNHRLNSVQQEGTGLAVMAAFFRAYIGNAAVPASPQFVPLLKGDDPLPPSALTSEIYRTYHAPDTPTTRRDIDRYLSSADLTTNTLGGAVTQSGLSPYQIGGGAPYAAPGATYAGPETLASFVLPTQPAARQPGDAPSAFAPQVGGLSQLKLGWSALGASLTHAIPAAAKDFTPFKVLTFRTGVDFTDWRNYVAYDDFDVVLTDTKGNSAYSPVSAWSSALLFPPGRIVRLPKVEMNGVRIPLAAFSGVDLSSIASVKFVFDRQTSGAILLTDLALSD